MSRFFLIVFLLNALLSCSLNAGQKRDNTKADEPTILANGFKVQYFATPPEIEYPSCVAVSPSGVVFVGIDPYNVRANKSKTGKIKMFVDTKGAGKADKSTVFADNTNGPRGMCYVDGTLFVAAAPTLTAYRDDGSGKAASEDVLIEGYGFPPEKLNPDHSEAGVRMAIDGWLYLAVGDQGFLKAVSKDKIELQCHGGGICRIRPDGTEFEMFCHGTRNTYDIAIDPLLNGYTRDNTNDGRKWNVRFAHMVQGAEYGYPSLFINFPEETLPCLADWGGGSGTGALYIQEPYMPEGFGNVLLTCDWGRGKIYSHKLTPDGSTFKVEQTEFFKGTKPLDLDIDGRGRIFISDWRGATYGKEKDPNKPTGYIAVAYNEKGINPAEFPDLHKASDSVLVGYVISDSSVLRLNAQQALLKRPFKQENADELLKVVQGKAPLYARVAALFTYTQMLGVKSHAAVAELLKNDEMREFAIRALADRKTQLTGLEPKLFIDALKDTNPRVRVQAEIALMRLNKTEAAGALLPMLLDRDVEVSHLAMRALRAINGSSACLSAVNPENMDISLEALKVLREMHDKAVVEGLIKMLGQIRDETLHGAIVDTLSRLYFKEKTWDGKWWGIPPSTVGPHYQNEKWEQTDEITKVLSKEFDAGSDALKAAIFKMIVRYHIPTDDLPGALAQISNPSAKLTPELSGIIVQLAELKPQQSEMLERIALDTKLEAATRALAVEAFGRIKISDDPKNKNRAPDKAARDAAIKRALDTLLTTKDAHKDILAAAAKLIAGMKEFAPADLANWVKAPNNELREAIYGKLVKSPNDPAAQAAINAAWREPAQAEWLLNAIEKNKAKEFTSNVRNALKDSNGNVRKAAIKATASLGDPAAVSALFDCVEKIQSAQDAISALDKIGTEGIAPINISGFAERAAKIAEAKAGDKDEMLASAAHALGQKYADDKRLSPALAKSLKERLAKHASNEPEVGDFEPSDEKHSATTEQRYKDLVASLLNEPGDKTKGKDLFMSQTLGCTKCHTLTTKEPPKGPFLGDIGSKYKRADLIESIVLPSEKIVMGYEPKMITVDGEDLTGFVTNQSGDKFELHMASGEVKVIEKSKVEGERKLKLSIMPSGLVSKLTHKQFANLLAFLESLQKQE